MHPAFSVIFFTTLTGTGYGLLFWLGLHYAWRPLPLSPEYVMILLGFALALVTVGLCASVLHLGKPLRAWRAFSQWKTSWLSREGVAALASYLPALWLAAAVWFGDFGPGLRLAGALTALASLATVACTAMIYASLKPIPAWSHPLVLPAYLAFALFAGLIWLGAFLSLTGWRPQRFELTLALALLAAVATIKLVYWRQIRRPLDRSRASATGLSEFGEPRTFERPHTEENYLTREMGFVVARKHANALRAIALAAFAIVPLLLIALAWLGPLSWTIALFASALAIYAGSFVERWLFFAEAKHLVMLYY